MKKFTLIFILLILFSFSTKCSAQLTNLKRIWTAPYVMDKHDGEFSFHLEVKPNGQLIDSIKVNFQSVPLYQSGELVNSLIFFDDGLNDDLLANDQIFTASDITPRPFFTETTIKTKPTLKSYKLKEIIYYSGADEKVEPADMRFVLRWFNPASLPKTREINSEFQHTSYVANIVDKDLENDGDNIQEVFKRYYNHLPDDRHTMVILSMEAGEETSGTGSSLLLANNIEGIGLLLYNHSTQYHSNSILEQRIYLSGGSENTSTFFHELHHRWGVKMPVEFNISVNGHWKRNFEMTGSGFIASGIEQIVSNGDSTFNVYLGNSGIHFNSIDMYLAGYASLDDIEFPIKVLNNYTFLNSDVDGSQIFYSEDTLQLITKDLFVEKLGIRNPSYLDSRKEQRVGLIVRSQKLLTPVELSFFHKIMSEHEKTEESIYSPTYFEQTFGEGRLNTKIWDEIVPVKEKKLIPSSFNVYPNPTFSELFIEKEKGVEIVTESIQISDLSGIELRVEKIINNKVDVSNLPTGTYFLRINTDKGIYNYPFVKIEN